MSIVLLQKDPFVALEEQLAEDPYAHNANVRRPLYGISEVKITDNPRFAFLSVYQDQEGQEGAQPISLIDSSAPGGFSNANHNFILQSVQEQRSEKVQVIETFGDHFAFFYGQKPIIIGVSGFLFNTADFNWKNEFLANYDRFLRGTRCAETRTRVFMGWDDVLAQGYMLNVSINYDKDLPNVVPFQFSLLLTKPPIDLSNAAAPLDTPTSDRSDPWTYRSLGDPSFDTRTKAGRAQAELAAAFDELEDVLESQGFDVPDTNFKPEYLTQPESSTLVTLDSVGNVKVESGSEDNVPEDQEPTSAYWISGTNPGTKQWKDEEEALLSLSVSLTAAQTGADPVTTRLALQRDPDSFQFTNRNDATLAIAEALGRGVSNAAAVLPDAPDVE